MPRMRWGGVVLAVVLSFGAVACSGSTPAANPASTTPSMAAAAESLAPTTPAPSDATSATPPTSASAAATASALDDLAAFVAAAREVDARLHAATPLLNASVRTDAIVVDAQTAAVVQAIDYSAAASAIPAGMPPELMRQVLVAYSDLVSRTLAVSRFTQADRTYSRIPAEGATGPAEGEEMVACLANGSQAAQRFEADLAAVVATARATPPLLTVEPTSLAHPELLVRLQEVVLRNGGCGACGGYVATRVSSISWDDAAAASATTRTGTVRGADDGAAASDGGVSFTATYSPGAGWAVDLNAC